MDGLEAALVGYAPRTPVEAADLARARALLAAADPWSRSLPLHLTGSVLVVDPGSRRVLLRWHPRMRRWLQVGGHGDAGERDPWVVAGREATEETGLTDLQPLTPEPGRNPVHVVVVAVPGRRGEPAHEHADVRYVLATGRPDDVVTEFPDAPLRWMTLAAARGVTDEANLLDTLERVARFLTRIR